MPISLAQLKANLRTINVPYFDDNLSVTYRPSELTPQITAEIQDRVEAGEGNNVAVETLCRVMTAWDLMSDKDKMVPITPDELSALPGPLLLAIFEAIAEDGRPKPRSAKGSFAR